MKLIAFVAAGLLAAAAVQPTPVEAQPRHGWHNDRHGSHWNRGHRSRWRNVCRTQWRHGHRVRRCTRQRVRW